MKITHYVGGGVQDVNKGNSIGGSYHIMTMEIGGKTYKVLMDIGNQPSNTLNKVIENPFMHMDVTSIDAVSISHVHQDHIGNCIRLVTAGYTGPIYMSEKSKAFAKVIFDDSLKHEKEEVEEYNSRIERIIKELEEAWFTVRVNNHTPETRHIKHPHGKISDRFLSLERMFEGRIGDILRDYAIKKTKYRHRVKEILCDSSITERNVADMLGEIPVHENKSRDGFLEACIALKREIEDSQHNFHGMQHEEAKRKLEKYNINSKDDIYDLNKQLALMEFDENDVLQVIKQIKVLPLHQKISIIPGVLDVTAYSAGHVEGAIQQVWTAHEDNVSKSWMYTGDLGRTKQPSGVGKPEVMEESLDYVITEGTYAGRSHNDRLGEIKKIITDINAAKDICLVPCFALQRMQDVLCVLVKAIKNNELKLGAGEKIYCHSPLGYNLTKEFISQDTTGTYKDLSNREILTWIERHEEVMDIMSKPGRKIIVCSGGMMERGTITQYIDKAHSNKDATIVLTGFQVPGTNGYKILHGEFDEPVYLNNKVVTENHAHIGYYPLSGHADHDELRTHAISLHYTPTAQITIVHGGEARHVLAQDIKTTLPQITINVPDENNVNFTF